MLCAELTPAFRVFLETIGLSDPVGDEQDEEM